MANCEFIVGAYECCTQQAKYLLVGPQSHRYCTQHAKRYDVFHIQYARVMCHLGEWKKARKPGTLSM